MYKTLLELRGPVFHPLVLIFHTPSQQSLTIIQENFRVFARLGEIVEFPRIFLKIEQQRRHRRIRKLHVFVAVVPHHPEQTRIRVQTGDVSEIFLVMDLLFSLFF